MLRYVKFSLLLHLVLFGVLVFSFYLSPQPKVERLKFVILPKGTGVDHVLTKQIAEKLTQPPGEEDRKAKSEERKEMPSVAPSLTPAVTPALTPEPALSPTPHAVKATPNETPAVAERATPAPTAEVTGTPKPAPTPQKDEMDEAAHSTTNPKPSPTPSPTKAPPNKTATPKPQVEASPTAGPGGKPVPKEKLAAKTVQTPKKTPTPAPKQLASAYDLKNGQAAGRDPRLPKLTPVGATVADEVPTGKHAGVPGVADGVEGAPLALNANQSPLPQTYTNRAILLLQRNFLVPEGVNDPDLICIVEWEILSGGTVKTPKIVKSTGTAEYDQRALDAVEKTGNLGPLPSQFSGKSIWVSLPFIFGQ